MADDAFRAKVSERRQRILAESAGQLTSATRRAVATLRALLNSKSDAVKLGACREILAATLALKTVTEFESRLLALETKKK
jgi:hypothetical protein